jgi:hypothetical protein
MEREVSKLAAAEYRLREEIRSIVRHRIPPGMRLNWRMMFEIEDEAVARLQEDDQLDLHYVNIMVSPSAQRSPPTEKPAELADIFPTHTALRMIQEAHQQEH